MQQTISVAPSCAAASNIDTNLPWTFKQFS